MKPMLNNCVLTLNRNYVSIGSRTLRDAMKKLVNNYEDSGAPKALILDPETYATYTWADWSALKNTPPEIIVLTKYGDTPQHKIPFSRRAIYKRDHFCCQYCGRQPGMEELTIDHVTPRSKGGISSWENCVLSCRSCNKKKADKTLAQAKMKLRSVPKRPNFMPFVRGTGPLPLSWKPFLPDAVVSESYWDVELQP